MAFSSYSLIFLLAVIVAVSAKSCSKDDDCKTIKHGATKKCVSGVCACIDNFKTSSDGCELNVVKPTLEGPTSLYEGGDYSMKCVSSLSDAVLKKAKTIEYQLEFKGKKLKSQKNKNKFDLKDVDKKKAGQYTCKHSYYGEWTDDSGAVIVKILEAGKLCTSDSQCPKDEKAYDGKCDKTISRCTCKKGFKRDAQICDGAHQAVAVTGLVVILAFVSSLF